MVGKKKVILTPTLLKKIARDVEYGYLKNEIAVRLGITRQTLYRWIKKDDKLAALFTEALKIRAETYKEEIITIADNKSGDLLVDPDSGRHYPNAANVSRDTLRIKSREKIMALDDPKRYQKNTNVDITSNSESLFTGLSIIFGKDKEDE